MPRDGLLRACRGNPLALIEMARALTPEQIAGTAVLPDPLPAAGSLHQLFARRLGHLAPGHRLLLALAAAEPAASERLVRDAARRLGIGADRATAELRFSHPLARSAAYYDLPLPDRQRVHRALALEMSSTQHSDRVAWHLAMAATGLDESVASRLQ
jgi:hypothetical protein